MQILRRIYRLASLSAMAAMMLTSCINDDSLCPAEVEGDEQVTLEFTVVTRDLDRNGTRGLTYVPQGDNLRKGTVAENYLDLRNTVFLLFDNQKTLIKVFKPEVTPDIEEDYAVYTVKAFISATEFQTLTAGRTEGSLEFSIAVVGNYSLLNPQNAAYHIGQNLDDIFTDATTRVAYTTFAMPTRTNTGWLPSPFGTDAAYIPMAGIQTYNITIAELEGSTLQNPVRLSANPEGDINMLRALAKIEVIDRIDFGRLNPGVLPGRDSRAWIEKVELVGHTTRGSLFPTVSQWQTSGKIETQYVTAPTVPASAGYIGADPLGDNLTVDGSALVNFFEDGQTNDGCPVFSCYLTEIATRLLSDNDVKPWIRLTTQGPTSESGEIVDNASTPYRVELRPYTDGKPGDPMDILRNNIYRYEISGIKSDLELQLVVNKWASTTTEWDFDDVPGMTDDGYLQWTSANPVNPNYAAATIIYRSELTGTFTFAQPLGGTWNAMLALGPNTEEGSFSFVDKDGNEIGVTTSGYIDGSPAQIRIKATKAPNEEYDRSVRVLFTVTTPDGRIITAPILGSEYGNNKYVTIIQEKAL